CANSQEPARGGATATFLPNFVPYTVRLMASEPIPASPLFVPVGANPAHVFGLEAQTRACRLAEKAGMECADQAHSGRPTILAALGFAWDPAWLAAIKNHPDNVLMLGDRAVLAHVSAGKDT